MRFSFVYGVAAFSLLLSPLAVLVKGDNCADVPPDNQYSCQQQKDWGKCDADFMKGYCLNTCGKCPSLPPGCSYVNPDCTDNPPDNQYSCQQQKDWGKCNADFMTGYCLKTCGKCPPPTTQCPPTQAPTPSGPTHAPTTAPPTPSRPPTPDMPVPDMFAGANTWFIHTQSYDTRHKVMAALQQLGMRVIRIFVREFKDTNFVDYVANTDSKPVQDVEVQGGSGYDDTVLGLIDVLMTEVVQYNLKLIICMHDRWNMHAWQNIDDVYVKEYGVNVNGGAFERFYTDENWAMPQFNRRLQHVLNHQNPLMGNRTWGNIPEAVYAFENGNEEMWSANVGDDTYGTWHCNRAKVIRSLVPEGNGILIGTGGHDINKGFQINALYNCPELTLVTVHDYHGARGIDELKGYIDYGKQRGKKVVVGEFGCDAQKDAGGSYTGRRDCIENQVKNYEAAGMPWVYWSVVGHTTINREIWTDDPTWAMWQKYISARGQTA